MSNINITNECNMQLMARYPDNYFELAIVDPPYDFSLNKNAYVSTGKYNKKQETRNGSFKIGGNYLDALNKIPDLKYFTELFRVSKNQIIWGGNYFNLPPSSCWLVWDKKNGDSYFADCELAYSSFKTTIRKFSSATQRGNRIHPTQKPVALYEWLLMNYAKQGDKILDTHLGSGSIALACHNLKFDLTGCELDKDYYDAAMLRLKQHQQQLTMF
jgi:site-specific DNA-methyltransferase (adenine-specific)